MVKRTKEVEVTLYNFNAHDDEKNKKKKSKTPKKQVKKNNAKRNNLKKDSAQDNKFNFDNEIVIGLTRTEEKKEVKKEKTSKKINKKASKRTNKSAERKKNNKDSKNNTTKSIDKNIRANTKKKSDNKTNILKTQKPISKKEEEIKRQKRILGFRIAKYTVLSTCIVGVIIAIMTSPLFNIKEIIIEGNDKITKDEIISLSQINLDENTYKISKNKVEKEILENPYIKNVEIKRSLPSKIVITVEERKATYMIEYGNAYVYINNQGYILEVSNQKLEVPIIQGAETNSEELVPGGRLCNNDLIKMSTVIKIMELAANNEIANLITRIDMENDKNYRIVFESEQKVAYLGDDTDLNTKILSIKSILEKEKDIAGEIFVNMDLKTNYPTFRQSV